MITRVIKTRWLFPIFILGLTVLTIEFPISGADRSLADTSSATESMVTESLIKAETQEEPQTEFDDTTCGTY